MAETPIGDRRPWDRPVRGEGGPPRRWGSLFARLGFELVVIVIGVYAAFALSEVQASREAARRQAQIQAALVREIQDITLGTGNAASELRRLVTLYDSAYARSERPIPTPLIEPIRLRNHMWEAALGSGGLDLLDVEVIYRLSEFYNELNAGVAQLEQLRKLSEELLIPNLDGGVDEFYDETGRLRREYGWYLPAIQRLEGVADRITVLGDSLVTELGRGADLAGAR